MSQILDGKSDQNPLNLIALRLPLFRKRKPKYVHLAQLYRRTSHLTESELPQRVSLALNVKQIANKSYSKPTKTALVPKKMDLVAYKQRNNLAVGLH